jgi:hypothetical protein
MITDLAIGGADILMAKLGISGHGIDQQRYSGGVHYGYNPITKKYGYHIDKFDSNYGINFIAHNLFEASITHIPAIGPDLAEQLYFYYRYSYHSKY